MKPISLFYIVSKDGITPPRNVQIKDEWLDMVKRMVPSNYEPKMVKVTYDMIDPEIDKQTKFFNGVVVLYYAIQNMDLTDGVPDSKTLVRYREDLLDELLGYDYQGMNRMIRKRKSTTDFKTVERWYQFLKEVESLFESAGYEFPNTEDFWKLAKEHDYDEAKRITVQGLQSRLARKLQP